MLLLFVVLFSVILAMGAMSLDQGFWLGRHRATQAAADASARAGTLAFVANTNASSGCAPGDPRSVAALNADSNRIDVTVATCSGPNTSFAASADCQGAIDRPSVTADVGQELRAFFAGAFGIDDIETRAEATACVGTISTMGIDPGRDDHLISALPVYIQNNDTYSGRGCFNNGAPKIGQQCVIVRACERQGGSGNNQDDCTFGNDPVRSGVFERTDPDECEGDPTQDDILDAIRNRDMGFLCSVEDGNGCPGDNVCVDAEPAPDNVNEHADIMNAFEVRLANAPPECDEFAELFRRFDGGTVVAPWDSGGNPDETVYVPDQDCNMGDSGRAGILVFTEGSSQRVKGFATVYIIGCFTEGTNFTTQENTCSLSSQDDHDQELRGVLLRTYLPETDRGDLGRVSIDTSGSNQNINIPFTTQTVE
ncbi:MAG: hypothetical protein WEB52_02085 [Dehalococcoidia bacterium]